MISVAIIGAGIGAQHLKGYRALPYRYAVKTLCDLDTDRARIIVGDDPNIDIVAEIDAVLADPAIQLVDICLPPHLHFPIIKAALAAGKDVICEKPLVRALAEAEEITAIAAASGRHVFPVFQYRFGRAMRHLRALMDAGIAGKALVASSEVHWNRGKGYYDVPWRGTWKGECGGAVLGHAIHAHDFLCCVLGPLAQVSAFTATRVNDIEVEDCAAISLRFASGALATSSVTLGAGNDTSRLRFCFAGFTAQSGTAPYTPAEDDWQFIARAPVTQDQIDAILAQSDAAQTQPDLGGFAGYLDAIADALQGKTGREVTLEDGRRSIELVTAIYKSARISGPVSLPLADNDPMRAGWMP